MPGVSQHGLGRARHGSHPRDHQVTGLLNEHLCIFPPWPMPLRTVCWAGTHVPARPPGAVTDPSRPNRVRPRAAAMEGRAEPAQGWVMDRGSTPALEGRGASPQETQVEQKRAGPQGWL